VSGLEQALQQIYRFYQSGRIPEALKAINQILLAAPRDAAVLQLAGMVRRGAGDLEGSVSAFKASIEYGGETAERLNSLGNAYVQFGAEGKAETSFRRALALSPAYSPALINLGRLHARNGKAAEALVLLERAITLDANSVSARLAMANILKSKDDFEGASVHLKHIIKNHPGHVEAHNQIGVLYLAQQQPLKALDHYDMAISANVQSPELLDNRAAALIELNDIDGAKRSYDQLTAQFPTYLNGHSARARMYSEFGIEGDGFSSFQQVASQFPSEPSIWQFWLRSLLTFRKYDEALDVADRAESAIGPDPSIKFAKAVALCETAECALSEKMFDEIEPAFGSDIAFLNARSRLCLKLQKPERAASFAGRATAISPDSQFAWAYLSLAWRLLADEREFWVHDYDKFIQQSPVEIGDLGELADAIRALHISSNHPAEQSLRGGTQTMGSLFARSEPEIVRLKAALQDNVRDYIDRLPDLADHPLSSRRQKLFGFSGSWSVRLTKEGFHIAHIHDAGWISSAMHIVLPEGAAETDQDAGCLQLGAPPAELALGLTARKVVRPVAGHLVLFPSSMWHSTIPFHSESERLTVAFDVIPKSE
jgi:tetratricopeptide (TPR) repeat protein